MRKCVLKVKETNYIEYNGSDRCKLDIITLAASCENIKIVSVDEDGDILCLAVENGYGKFNLWHFYGGHFYVKERIDESAEKIVSYCPTDFLNKYTIQEDK